MTLGQGDKSTRDAVKTIEQEYANNVFDEEFPAVSVINKKNEPIAVIKKEDAVIFFNYRSDRAIQLTEAFSSEKFTHFDRPYLDGLCFVSLTEYKESLPVNVAFPRQTVKNPLAKIFSDNKFTQLHLAETEKYAHVTYFLNGKTEGKFPGEDRILIPSQLIDDYAKAPEMSTPQITDELIKQINSGKHDFIVVNYANADMIGHTGNLDATIKAVDVLDQNLKE